MKTLIRPAGKTWWRSHPGCHKSFASRPGATLGSLILALLTIMTVGATFNQGWVVAAPMIIGQSGAHSPSLPNGPSEATQIVVSIWASPTTGPVPLTVNLTAQGSGCVGDCIITFFIGNANGSTNIGPDPGPSVANGVNVTQVTTITSVGSWVATAVVQDVNSDSGSANATIVANSGPGGLVIVANASVTSGAAPLLVTFTGNVTRGVGPYSMSWNFGDGGNGTGTYLQHTYVLPGTYQATFTVIDSLNRTASKSITIVVSPGVPGTTPLTLRLSASPNLGPAPLNVTLNASVGGGSSPYNLTVCDQTTDCPFTETDWAGGTVLFAPMYPSSGNFTVTATVTDHGGNQTVATTLVTVLPPSVLNVSTVVSARSGSSPLTVSFRAVLEGGVPPFSIQWVFGDGSFGTSYDRTTIFHTYENPGTYRPMISVSESGGRRVNQSLPTVTVAAGPARGEGLLPSIPSLNGAATGAIVATVTVVAIVVGYAGVWLPRRRRFRLEGEGLVQALEASVRR